MKYTETFEPLDNKDKMLFFKGFRTALIIAFIVGCLGFLFLFIDFSLAASFQTLSSYILIFLLPLIIFLIAYMDFKIKISSKTKVVSRATVVDKKHTLDSQTRLVNGVTEYIELHQYYLFLEGQNKPIVVDVDMFNFFQKQDTMVLYRRDRLGKIYRYEKNA